MPQWGTSNTEFNTDKLCWSSCKGFFLSVLILNLIDLHCFHFLYRGQNQTQTLWQGLAVHLNMNMLFCCDFSWKAQPCNNTLLFLGWRFRQEHCCCREQDCFVDWPLSDTVKFWNALAFILIILTLVLRIFLLVSEIIKRFLQTLLEIQLVAIPCVCVWALWLFNNE